jgi:hypothetical protein
MVTPNQVWAMVTVHIRMVSSISLSSWIAVL